MKVTIATFYFCDSKNPSDVMKNTFNSISIYFWKTNFLVNKYKKQTCCNKKISLLLKSWKMGIFFLQKVVIFNMITDSFLVEKWETLERARRYVSKNLLNLDCQDSICFAFFTLFKNRESFGKSFSFPFSAKCLDRNFKYLV